MTLQDALARFRDRLRTHCQWMTHNAQRIEELSFVLDELKQVETMMREDEAVRKIVAFEIAEQAAENPLEPFHCLSCGERVPRAPEFFTHLVACPQFRAYVLTEPIAIEEIKEPV